MSTSTNQDSRDQAIDRTQFLGEGRIGQLIRRLSVPAIGSMVSIALFQLVDAIFIGTLGTASLGAVSVAFPLFTVVGGVGQIFGTGAASMISRYLGANRSGDADKVASASLLGVLVAGVITATAINFILDPLLHALGGTDSIIAVGRGYARILVFANVLTMLNVTMTSIVRAEGNIKRGMYSVFISAGLNVALDPLFIFVFDMGLPGAAVATLVAQSAAFAFLSSTFFRSKNTASVSIRRALRGIALLPRVLLVGTPSFLLQLLGAGAIALINIAAAVYGDGAVAAVGLAFRILAVGMFPIYGFTTGFQPVVGFNYGAHNYDRVFSAIRSATLWALAFALVFAGVVVGFAPVFVRGFSTDPEVISIAVRMLRAVAAFFPLFGIQIVMAVLFQALGHALPAALIILSRQGLFFIPGILILPRFMGIDGIIATQPISDVLTSALTAIFAIVILRRLRREATMKSDHE